MMLELWRGELNTLRVVQLVPIILVEPDPWMKFRSAKGMMGSTNVVGGEERTPGTPYTLTKARSELLGGAEGREWIVGGFPVWSRKKVIEATMKDEVQPMTKRELAGQIESIFGPGPRGQIAIIKIKDQGSVQQNRSKMFECVEHSNRLKPQIKGESELQHTLWAGPSKPAHVHEEDQLVTETLSVARLLLFLWPVSLSRIVSNLNTTTPVNVSFMALGSHSTPAARCPKA